MKARNLLFLLLFTGIATNAYAAKPGSDTGTSNEYEFAGYSEVIPINTSGSKIGLHEKLCRDAFGPTAKWATSKEVFEAFDADETTPLPPNAALMRAVLVSIGDVEYDPYANASATLGSGCPTVRVNYLGRSLKIYRRDVTPPRTVYGGRR